MMTTYRESINGDVFMVHSFALNMMVIRRPSASAEFLYKNLVPQSLIGNNDRIYPSSSASSTDTKL